ncbi:MAG: hypothetical protein JNL34_09025 [Anaerolineae bacterium]|nr:hypothetical protein [Anaerolineae bacterium]
MERGSWAVDVAELRRWHLTPADPYCAIIAADARFCATDYADDQSWELQIGVGDSPALALSTRYGGRLGQASLAPLWTVGGQLRYAAQDFHTPPAIIHFAPGYLRADGQLTPELGLTAEFFVFESHACGGRFTLSNSGNESVHVRADLVGFAAAEGRERRVTLVPAGEGHALTFGKTANLRPVIVVEGGASDGLSASQVGVSLTIPARGEAVVRWAHGGEKSIASSLALAGRWLARDWNAVLARTARGVSSVPIVETGEPDLDILLAASYQQLLQAFLNPEGPLPNPSIVGTRHPGRGFSTRADGSAHPRAWAGQSGPLIYPAALSAAMADARLAQALVRNELAVQQEDGSIDWRPGLAGQQQGLLALPVLARLAWGVFQYTEDDAFLAEVFPGLLRFLRRWRGADLDLDGDGLPEWQSEVQAGYPFFPAFGRGFPWAQNADIGTAETPDLLACLLSEAVSLREMAFYLRDTEVEAECAGYAEGYAAALESLWDGERYSYRDRDTHQMGGGRVLFADAPADAPLFLAEQLDPPARLLITLHGGAEQTPRFSLLVEGLDADGQPLRETLGPEKIVWTHSRGTLTTQAVFGVVNALHPEGLSRVFRMSGATVDWSRRDINALLPMWAAVLPAERVDQLIAYYEAALRVPNGVTMVATDDLAYRPDQRDGAGGVWPYWLTLVGEGLIEAGRFDAAAGLLLRLLKAQIEALRTHKAFSEYLHSNEPVGLGEIGHVGGIAPLHLFLRVVGVRIVSADKVWAGGPFPLAAPVTVRRLGVAVTRSADGTNIVFPSGRTVSLPPGALMTEIVDEEVVPAVNYRHTEGTEGM